ncbi:hypothetical protein LY76DRAFT_27370, partial [Colletotrichum caudatum]
PHYPLFIHSAVPFRLILNRALSPTDTCCLFSSRGNRLTTTKNVHTYQTATSFAQIPEVCLLLEQPETRSPAPCSRLHPRTIEKAPPYELGFALLHLSLSQLSLLLLFWSKNPTPPPLRGLSLSICLPAPPSHPSRVFFFF